MIEYCLDTLSDDVKLPQFVLMYRKVAGGTVWITPLKSIEEALPLAASILDRKFVAECVWDLDTFKRFAIEIDMICLN